MLRGFTAAEGEIDVEANEMLQRILTLDYMLESGYTITPDEVPLDEFLGHRVLLEERRAFADEPKPTKPKWGPI